MTRLSVNINKIALLRNARSIGEPDLLACSDIIINAGAYGITVHPRPDERHIKYCDARQLSSYLPEGIEFNIEGNPFTGKFMDLLLELKPNQATLVPDSPNANTSDHGWNLSENKSKLLPVIKQLKDHGIRVSLFMDPDIEQIKLARQVGTDRIELYTEPYASAFRDSKNVDKSLVDYRNAANTAIDAGLGINAGHDLNLLNLAKFCNSVPGILEVSIGQAIVVDSIRLGLYNVVCEYIKILESVK